MNMKVHRRSLLRGLGWGGVMLAPFVRRMVAEAQGELEPNLIIFYTPNGFYRPNFGATGTHNSSTFTFKSSLASALTPHKGDIVVLEGLNNFCYPNNENSHSNINRVITCKTGTDHKVAAGPSFDHHVAGKFGGTPLVLGVEPQRADFQWHRQLSWAAAGSAVAPRLDTKNLFGQLFPTEPGAGVPDVAAQTNRRNKSVLDAIRGDVTTLQGRLDATGREKLDLHLTSLRELETSITLDEVTTMMCDTTALGSQVNASLPRPPSGTPTSSYKFKDLLRLHGEQQCALAANALACGKKRVATILWQECSWEGVNTDGVAEGDSHHNVSHWNLTDAKISGDGPTQLRAIDTFYATRFAYLVNLLKQLGILNHTIVLWVTEISEGHVQVKFTWVSAGGKDLGVRTDRYLQYPYSGPGNHPHTATVKTSTSDLFVSVQNALGIAGNTFGDAQYCFRGGLSEYRAG